MVHASMFVLDRIIKAFEISREEGEAQLKKFLKRYLTDFEFQKIARLYDPENLDEFLKALARLKMMRQFVEVGKDELAYDDIRKRYTTKKRGR